MKERQKFTKIVKEVFELITSFFKPIGLKDERLRVPNELRKMGRKLATKNLIFTILSSIFAYTLTIANLLVEQRIIILGIIFFMLNQADGVISNAYEIYNEDSKTEFKTLFDDIVTGLGTEIICRVSGKVFKYDEQEHFYRLRGNEELLKTYRHYIEKLWKEQIQNLFNKINVVGALLMAVVAVKTNYLIPENLFILLIIIFGILSLITSAYISIDNETYSTEKKEKSGKQDVIISDLLRVPILVKEDVDMRITNYQKYSLEKKKNEKKHRKAQIKINLGMSLLRLLYKYGLIIFFVVTADFKNINVGSLALITASLTIVTKAIDRINKLGHLLMERNSTRKILEREEEEMLEILRVHEIEIKKIEHAEPINKIELKPFEIKYTEKSENDKPFKLKLETQLNLELGDVTILYGPSGSGKSTFMSLLTGQIKFDKDEKVQSTSRFLLYDANSVLGNLSIFEEMFCCNENPDLAKMQDILENLHLSQEICSNCLDIWQWMREKTFKNNLSNGQKQRLVLAKLLYWLDSDIDCLVLDECTSGLDDSGEEDYAYADDILEYVVRYANKDKKRLIIISTHQNLDSFKENISDKFRVRSLYFNRQEGISNIIEK